MTLLLLLALIYTVLGAVTGLEVRTIGLPDAMHFCSLCASSSMYRSDRCPERYVGRGPLTLFGWVGAVLFWPVVWGYAVVYFVLSALIWVGTRRI